MARRSAKVANHNKEFEEAQSSFLERADKGALERAYKIAYDLAKRYIINYGKNAGVFIAAVEEKAHDVATTIVERKLILRKGAPIKRLTSYIYYDCKHVVIKSKRTDEELYIWQCEDIIAAGADVKRF